MPSPIIICDSPRRRSPLMAVSLALAACATLGPDRYRPIAVPPPYDPEDTTDPRNPGHPDNAPKPRELTPEDRERLARAEAKRARKASRLMTQKGPEGA